MLGQTGATLEERQRWLINVIIIAYRPKIILAQVEGNYVYPLVKVGIFYTGSLEVDKTLISFI